MMSELHHANFCSNIILYVFSSTVIMFTTTYQMMFFFGQILEGRSFKLKYPWVGVVNRSQADINKNVDMIAARRREREYFSNTTEYRHLAHKMGSEHLAKMLSKVRAITRKM